MAQDHGRLYRDYMLDDEHSWAAPSRDTPTSSHSLHRADTPQTVVRGSPSLEKEKTISQVADRRASQLDFDFAQKIYDDQQKTDTLNTPGAGIARTTEESYIDDSSSSGSTGEETREPTLEPEQVEPPVLKAPSKRMSVAAGPGVPYTRQTIDPGIKRAATVKSSTDRKQTPDRVGTAIETKLPEFFGMSVFQAALYNPTISHQLLQFGHSRLCGENMEFLSRVRKYQSLIDEVRRTVVEMNQTFIIPESPSQINVAETIRLGTTQDAKTTLSSTLPLLEAVFRPAQAAIEDLIYTDVYPEFVRQQMALSAARALGGDRSQYAGLGDCFVLTDPTKADNPIVYASDGFIKVTGYQRHDIIPRNCRFLQGSNTNQTSVQRLRKKIEEGHESVELLLNYKKTGEPFWNLLYTTPLFDENGRVRFFLGGQVNCSTTVHSSSDVLRILGQSREAEDEATMGTEPPNESKPTRGRRWLSAFRNSSSSNVQQRKPGMESELLGRLGAVPLKGQIDMFYSAYSNYIVINYSSLLITFVSAGILDILFPIKTAKSGSGIANAQSTPAVGTEVFRFLANHGSGSLSSDFKAIIKSALKNGNAISVELKLCARPSMGFEKFILHWTPLKDAKGIVHWLVLTLGNENRA